MRDAPPDAAPAALARRLAGAGALVLLVPAALERLGVVPDDEAVRLPLAFAACALVAARPGARPSRPALVLAALAAVAGALVVLSSVVAPTGATPGPLAFVGPPLAPALLALAVVAGARGLARRDALAAALRATTALATLAAVWTLGEHALGLPAVGPFGRAGVAGPALAALLPVAALTPRGRPRPLRVAPAVAVAAAIVGTGSRTGLGAAALALPVALALARGRAGRPLLAVAAGLALLGAAAVAGVVSGAPVAERVVGRPDTVRVRVGLARAAVALVAERPLLGHGAYGFPAQALRVRDPDEARISAGRRPLAAHDDVLHVAVEGGVGAGLALAAWIVLALVVAVRATRRAAAEGDGAGPAALVGLLLAVAVASLAENPLLASSTVLLAGLAAGAAAAHGRAASPSRRATFPAAVATGLALLATTASARGAASRLHDGSYRASDASRERAYEVAAGRARGGDVPAALEAYATLLAWDAGATEARLDVARLHELAGRAAQAREVLDEARRLDPTRFDVPMRVGHLLLGPERPVDAAALHRMQAADGDRREQPVADVAAVLRAYNEAKALDASRFEVDVGYARVYRRQGELARAGAALRDAKEKAARRGQGLPAELLAESFRLAEAERAPVSDRVNILALTLAAGPFLTPEVAREATRWLDAGDDVERAGGTAATPLGAGELAKADREGATVRLAALLRAGRLDPEPLRAEAAALARDGRDARALAIYRALLADPFAVVDTDLVLEARAVAARADRAVAEQLAARARTLLGLEALARGDGKQALFELEAALAKDPTSVAALLGRAKALALAGRPDEGARELGRAARLDARAWDEAARDATLSGLVPLVPREFLEPPTRR
ncbi:MAG: tetratricopeptide repeat protein [Planctomycetes bacterium]|nr:tetratricopeptide repeat protein [Planctomycetota bacterium]